MNDETLWASMDVTERNLRLEYLHRHATAALIAALLAGLFLLGPLASLFLGGAASSLTYLVLRHRMTGQLRRRAIETA